MEISINTTSMLWKEPEERKKFPITGKDLSSLDYTKTLFKAASVVFLAKSVPIKHMPVEFRFITSQ